MLQTTLSTSQKTMDRAQVLRRKQTSGEKVLWKKIRAKRFHEYKFRRQVPLGPYIADFLCTKGKLIVEIDGDSHYESGAKEHDQVRDVFFQSHGFRVMRFGNRQTIENLEWVLMEIGKVLGIAYE